MDTNHPDGEGPTPPTREATPATPSRAPVGPVRVGPYEVIRPIGEGGMAEIYLAVRRGVGGFARQVVMKVLHSRYVGDPSYVDMFLEEARILARLHHPNIVAVFDVDCVEGVPYLAMEYVNGPTLGRLHTYALKAGYFELGHFLYIVQQICNALHYAHTLEVDGQSAGIVHRDISGANILVEAETGTVKLIDFGIATTADLEDDRKTEVGVLKGRLQYLAPEVVGGRRGDARADLYAVGVVLYRLLTNRMPFEDGENFWTARQEGRYPRITQLSPWVSPELEAIVDRAMRPDPAKRYTTAAELAADLEREIKRMGTDPGAIPEWIRQIFPHGGASWAPRAGDGSTMNTLHSALSQIAVASQAGSVALPPPVADRSRIVLTTLALAVLAFVLGITSFAAVWTALDPGDPAPTDVASFVRAAEELLAEGNFDGARAMNERAATAAGDDVTVAVDVARQKANIERAAVRATASAQIKAGRLDEARATLIAAMDANPSDVELQKLYTELMAKVERPLGSKGPRAAVLPPPDPLLAPPNPETEAMPTPVQSALTAAPEPTPASPEPVAEVVTSEGVRVFHTSELKVERRVPAPYPPAARASGLGSVRCLARVEIREDGVPTGVTVDGCPSVFHATTEQTLLKWRWAPPQDERGPIKAVTTIAVNYSAK